MRTSIALVATLLIASMANAQAEVFVGYPNSKVESGKDGTDRFVLSEADRREYGLVIESRDGKLYWKSRENRELVHIKAGAFDVLLDLRGAGYIKILDPKGMEALFGTSKVQYLEFLTTMLGTITYFGTAESGLP